MKYIKTALLAFCLMLTAVSAEAQCGIDNKAFQSGEFLQYDLFFNWKFVWVKVGSASMSTVQTTYKGQPAWRSSLITRGNNKLDNMFVMRDTLLSYCNKDLAPLYYRKGAREGKRYYVDELWFSYPNGNCNIKMCRLDSHGEKHRKTVQYRECIYDMMSIFLRARNFDPSTWQKGHRVNLPITDAKNRANTWLTYRGKEVFKMDGNNEKYQCLVLSFMEKEDGKTHELIRFYITDDQNHIPVRLDMFLSFGSAKAFLKGYKGVRSAMTSKIK